MNMPKWFVRFFPRDKKHFGLSKELPPRPDSVSLKDGQSSTLSGLESFKERSDTELNDREKLLKSIVNDAFDNRKSGKMEGTEFRKAQEIISRSRKKLGEIENEMRDKKREEIKKEKEIKNKGVYSKPGSIQKKKLAFFKVLMDLEINFYSNEKKLKDEKIFFIKIRKNILECIEKNRVIIFLPMNKEYEDKLKSLSNRLLNEKIVEDVQFLEESLESIELKGLNMSLDDLIERNHALNNFLRESSSTVEATLLESNSSIISGSTLVQSEQRLSIESYQTYASTNSKESF